MDRGWILGWFLVSLNAGLSALNFGMFVSDGSPLSMGAGVFCGFMTVYTIAIVHRWSV